MIGLVVAWVFMVQFFIHSCFTTVRNMNLEADNELLIISWAGTIGMTILTYCIYNHL